MQMLIEFRRPDHFIWALMSRSILRHFYNWLVAPGCIFRLKNKRVQQFDVKKELTAAEGYTDVTLSAACTARLGNNQITPTLSVSVFDLFEL